ncbi:unnamed protein product [Chironomus riparius]|uniref:Histone RNA hairpin-binding protein RNA-binding domain-containing protein n=1 Tax=Chironomus riparius TaxID=315576 RepID=A0A9P0NIA6_9DIPT|nr:unnamed protein product [Chironomus riparius]
MSNNKSWLDLLDSSNSSDAHKSLNKTPTKVKTSSFEAHDEDARFIEIEIFDAANQKKFDKLASDNKIKSPFKRRLENEVVEKQPEKKFKESNDKNGEPEDSDDDENNKKPLRKRFCSERSSESSSNCSSTNYIKQELETDQATLERRQKQIDYGKNTIGYDNYMKEVPKYKRTRDHPKTPPKQLKYSRRAWEGLIKSWRKKLHAFDPNNEDNDEQE